MNPRKGWPIASSPPIFFGDDHGTCSSALVLLCIGAGFSGSLRDLLLRNYDTQYFGMPFSNVSMAALEMMVQQAET